MNIEDIQVGAVTTLEVRHASGDTFGSQLAPGAEAVLSLADVTDEILFQIGQEVWPVVGIDTRYDADLHNLLERDLPRLAWLAGVSPKRGEIDQLVVEVHEFPQRLILPESLELAVDEKIIENVQNSYLRRVTDVDTVLNWLAERAILKQVEGSLSPTRVLVSAGVEEEPGTLGSAFQILGRGLCLKVERTSDDKFLIMGIRPLRKQITSQRPVTLLYGDVRFRDATVAGRMRGVARTQLDQLVAQAGSYFKIWEEYNRLERDYILGQARELQWLDYHKVTLLSNGIWRFEVSARSPDLLRKAFDWLRAQEGVDLEADMQPPVELLSQPGDPQSANEQSKRHRDTRRSVAGKLIALNERTQTVDVLPMVEPDEGGQPPMTGVLFMALRGHRTMLRRREQSYARVRNALCPMPQLGLLLEGKPVPLGRYKQMTNLVPAARQAFDGEPTPAQVEAVRIAVNSPDVALIQGPPGTGKTRVIAAIEAQLAEMAEKSRRVAGRTLLCSYQHDAVENAVSRTQVYGLPPEKIGERHNRGEIFDNVGDWSLELAEQIQADLAGPEKPARTAYRQVANLAKSYMLSPGHPDDTAAVLKQVYSLALRFIPTELGDRLFDIAQRLVNRLERQTNSNNDDAERLLRSVRSLRTDANSFADDGPHNAMRLLLLLEKAGRLNLDAGGYLEQAAYWSDPVSPPFLEKLEDLKVGLLDHLAPQLPILGAPARNKDVEDILLEVLNAFDQHIRDTGEGKIAVLYDYLDDLQNNRNGVRDAIREYTAVLASTCQQSVSDRMVIVKGVDLVDDVEFETVIVDEAARATPLDLLIPMAHAKRRIILVGDHRQLPHMLEPDVERELEQSQLQTTKDVLQKSLFERLFLMLREREHIDGVRRTITLDTQYRMHPVLGQFVSETFYEEHEQFGSGRPPARFTHDLSPYQNKVAVWINVPRTRNETGGRSKFRHEEAVRVAQELKRLIDQRQDLSFGVITFYAAQVQEILRAMYTLDLAEQTEDGAIQISPAYRKMRGPDGKIGERLRVGTVDAFQGKEFDVVLLSMTRSNDYLCTDDKSLKRKYGFLLLENRLCVAMSRQKRMLIVVGDEDMLVHKAAHEKLRGLARFHEICEGPYGVRV